MQRFKGTKGEWKIHDYLYSFEIKSSSNRTLIEVHKSTDESIEDKANAQLVKSSFELLKMVDEMAEELEWHEVSVKKAQEARELISKIVKV